MVFVVSVRSLSVLNASCGFHVGLCTCSAVAVKMLFVVSVRSLCVLDVSCGFHIGPLHVSLLQQHMLHVLCSQFPASQTDYGPCVTQGLTWYAVLQ